MIVEDSLIITEIERLLDPFQRLAEHWAKYSQYAEEGRVEAWRAEHPQETFLRLRMPLIASLHQHPIFGHTNDRFFGTKQLTLFPDHQVDNLLRFAAEQGAEAAVAWLHRVAAVETADLRFVAEVFGLGTHEQHTLRNSVTLMPLAELPPSENARVAIAQYQTTPYETFSFVPFPPIGATLVETQVPGLQRSSRTLGHPIPEKMVNTIRAFTLVDRAAPAVGTSWIEFVNPDLARAELGRIWSGTSFEGALWNPPPTEITADALQWVDKSSASTGSEKFVRCRN